MGKHLLVLICLLTIPSSTLFGDKAQKYLQIISEQNINKIANSRDWQVLLHYKISKEGKYESLADGKNFFLSKQGKFDPKAELIAHLEAILTEDNPSIECKFPARYHWIRKKFDISESLIPKPECPKFKEFYKQMEAKSLSVIFASFHPEHPASLFGHTMLKFNEDNPDSSIFDDVVVNYAASIPQKIDPLSYLAFGLTGGFPGSFEIQKYKFKIYEYNEYENRDLWEFKLNLNKQEIDQLIRHLWEMMQNHFDYYFFDENCSFRVLTLLEVARPNLNLTKDLTLLVAPTDTLKKIAIENNLLDEVQFRPSIIARYRHKYSYLEEDEEKILKELINGNPQASNDLSGIRKTLLYDIYIDYLLIKKSKEYGTLSDTDKKIYAEAFQSRGNHLSLNQLPEYFQPQANSNPIFGHSISQVYIYGGNSSNGNFSEISIRPALRDFTDPSIGYSPYSQLSFLKTNLRYYEGAKTPNIQEMHFVEMTSLHPVGEMLFSPSWRVNAGLKSLFTERNRIENPGSTYGFASAGLGIAFEPMKKLLHNRLLGFGFIDIRGDYADYFNQSYRLGTVTSAGIIYRLTEAVGFQITGDYRSYLMGQKDFFQEYTAQLTIRLRQNISLEGKAKRNNTTNLEEWMLGIKYYF